MGNMISSIGAVFMALGTIVLLFNVIKTTVSKEKAGRDPWDARTLGNGQCQHRHQNITLNNYHLFAD